MSVPRKKKIPKLPFPYPERESLHRHLIMVKVPDHLRKQVMRYTYGGIVSVDCVLCGRVISNTQGDWGCHPYPVAHTGECCNDCHTEKVIPARRGLFDTLAAAIDASCRKAIEEALEKRAQEGVAK